MRICLRCLTSIDHKRADAIFCSRKCKRDHWYRKRYPVPAIRLTEEESRLRRKQRKKRWQEQNKERHLENMRRYCRKRYKEDVHYRLAVNLRNRLNVAIKSMYKKGSAVEYLGCSIEEFKLYLESKFLPGMTWNNYGRNGWHIDHIKPLSSFDLTDPKQLKQACHYTNLRPMWANDNIRKSNKLLETL